MKTTLFGFMFLCAALSATALDRTELDNRIRTLTAKFDALQSQSGKAIPAETLRKAQGIVLLDRTKAGFIFAYQGGGGVALARDKSGKWGPAAFLSASEASLGFQVGGEQAFYAILFMNTNSLRMLTDSKFDFGGEARGTAGDNSAGAEGKVTSDEPGVVVYDNRSGLYGGAALKGGAISPDHKANSIYYGQSWSMQDILIGRQVKTTDAATALAAKITDYSKPPAKK